MTEKVLVLHHNDRDGYVSAATVRYFYEYSGREALLKTCEINYEKPLDDIVASEIINFKKEYSNDANINFVFDTIYLLDYSITNERNKLFIEKFHEKYPNTYFVWIDHHVSSITSIDYDVLSNIPGLRIVGLSGAALCWLYFLTPNVILEQFNLFKFNNRNKEVPKETAKEVIDKSNMLELIEYTHRYDIFDLNDNILEFNYGYTTLDVDTIYADLENLEVIPRALERGRLIKSYIDEQNEKIVNEYAIPYTFKYTSGDITALFNILTLNHNTFSSLVFGETIKDYDFVMIWSKKKNCYRCSFYKGTDSDIDLSVFAKIFGGGGHPGAAGFTLHVPFWELTDHFEIVED